MIKFIFYRLLIGVAIFFGLNEFYLITFWTNDVNKHADTLENLWVVPKNSDAIYFGESSNFHITEKDTFKHRISYILDDLVTNHKIATVDNAGLHLGTYLALMQNIPRDLKIKYLVITLNLRSFDATWRYSEFETNLSKLERLIGNGPKLWNKFLVSLNHFDNKTSQERDEQVKNAWTTEYFNIPGIPYHNVAEWDKAIAWGEWTGTIKKMTPDTISLAAHHVKNFAFEIDFDKNERIFELEQIIDLANQKGWVLFFNVLAENVEQTEQLIGPELVDLMKRNVTKLKKQYESQNVIFIDNLELLPDSCFVDRNWPTEHYNYKGKEIVAKVIAQKIKNQFN